MQIRNVSGAEVDLIEVLFREVYGKKQGRNYWEWCFDNPYRYMNAGMFEGNSLIGYYACNLTEHSGCMVSAMVHPEYRQRGIFMELSDNLLPRIAYFRDWIYLFSNEMIRPIHIKKEKFTELYRIKEYRITTDDLTVEEKASRSYVHYNTINIFNSWRYENHPLNYYFMNLRDKAAIFNIYKDRLQIVHYDNIENAIELAKKYAHKDDRINHISFWSNTSKGYPYKHIPTWLHVKRLNEDTITMIDIKQYFNKNLHMGLSDVY